MDKILFIHHSGLIGGAGVSLINNVKFLSQLYEVCVYVPSDPSDICEKIKVECDNVRVEIYGKRIGALTYYSGGDSPIKLRFWYRAFLIFQQWQYWNNVIEKENPNIVIANSMVLSWMSRLPAVSRRKSICFVRETKTGKPGNWLNAFIHNSLDQYSRVVFISNYDKNKEALSHANTSVIYNYVDSSQLDCSISREDAEKRLGLKHDVFRVLFVGGVVKMKGFDLAVKGTLECNCPIELLVAGISFEDSMNLKSKEAKKYAEEMQALLEQEDRNKRIHILGKQSNMSDCYAACDVLVFPMRSPHQARPVFEAGYFGKPVIISDFENIREFVEDAQNGFTVRPESVESIKDRLNYLYSNPEFRKKMGEDNRKRSLMNHSMDINSQSVADTIEKTLRG